MRFDLYGKFELHVVRQDGAWQVFRLVNGKRQALPDIFIPSVIPENEIERYLDDLLHEQAQPGQKVRRLE